uniref:Uncharacterized protein n=1 Tax=Kalanchoe fedtschenkoi TaxID=63787 RepID=A0A7N0VM50_KALFE
MASPRASSSKYVACFVGLLLLAALDGEAAGVELMNLGSCLSDCGNQMVQCTTTCAFRGLQALQCLEECGVANVGCMGKCSGLMAVATEKTPTPPPSPSKPPKLGLELKEADLGN